jgi:SAM-dependent methyltransferase
VFRQSARYYDAVYSWKDYAGEAERVHELVQARKPGAASLLDVACGTGAHLAELRRWYRCAGLDLEPELLAVARERLPDVPLLQGDMRDFDLGRRFDAVTCLFSSIGYMRTVEELEAAVAAMARHLEPGGVLLVEPWLTPEAVRVPHVAAVFVDEPELKIARLNNIEVEERRSSFDFHYLVGTSDGVEHFTERHDLTLFTREEQLAAFQAAGLAVEHDEEGLMGRGLYIGVAAQPSAVTPT